MVDTVRSVAALQALLADNTGGAISPQDIRDLFFSLIPQHGALYISTPAATTISQAGTPVKAAGTTTAGVLGEYFDMPADNRLRYIGAVTVHATVAGCISFTAAGNNIDVSFALRKNGVEVPGSHISSRVGTGADERTSPLHGDVVLAPNDYLEVWVANETSTASVTLSHLFLSALTHIA